jgi:hypothetical protein
MEELAKSLSEQISKQLLDQSYTYLTGEISKHLANININSLVNDIVESKLENIIKLHSFPKHSIDHSSINFKGFNFTGDQIQGGIIKNFSSIGIDDRANNIQLTLMDKGSVFEGTVFAPAALIKGSLTVEGDLVVLGDIDSNSPAANTLANMAVEKIKADTELLELHSDAMLASIGQKGIDLKRITQDGREIVNGNQLGYQITDSNLQRVGMLRDLQTQGEALLSDTLYVTGKRVGINTIEPSATFVIWDQEVEMIITKRSQDVGYIGTPRNQNLVLGANNKHNLTLDQDGSVEIENLRVGNTPMSSASVIPNYNAITGTIVWNESPAVGGPIGWVCLGGSSWAKFGIIT